MGKLKRGDQPGAAPAETSDPQAASAASQEEELPATQMVHDMPATQMVQDTLAPTQKPVEESFGPQHMEATSIDVTVEALEAVATEKLEDAPIATEKLDHEDPDLQGLLLRHISELEEVSTQMTQRQKALVGVYKALQAFL